ncbi:hypothetical protein K445DRAFT_317387 [Daldinia sp. EC12]|nr:hypothetical protein K445DRAFT_317387 [Daldinia sp. EC12]
MASSSKSYSLQIAELFHNTTGKDQLSRICVAGFFLESWWHMVAEKKFMKTPPHVTRQAVLRAGVLWTAVYFGTSAILKWAERKVERSKEIRT